MAKVTGLSGNEINCMALKGLSPGELVVGEKDTWIDGSMGMRLDRGGSASVDASS